MLSGFFHIFLAVLPFEYSSGLKVAGKVNLDFVQSLINYILLEEFTNESPVHLLLSSVVKEDFARVLDGQDLPSTLQCLEDMTLKFVHENSLLPVTVSQPEKDESSFDNLPKVRNNGYIIFVSPQTEEFLDVFSDNIWSLQSKSSWNSRSKFLIVAYGELGDSPTVFAEIVLGILKSHDNVTNSVLLIISAGIEENNTLVMNEDVESASSSDNITSIYVYTLLPYLDGACDDDVPRLIGKWNLDNDNESKFIGVDYFPQKIPNNFMGCTLKISSLGPEPYVIRENYIRPDGENDFLVSGISMELIVLFANEMNFTVKFLEPTAELDTDLIARDLTDLQSGNSDILTGGILIMEPLVSLIDVSVPYAFDSMRFVVPCPKPTEKIDKIFTLFSSSIWAMMALVFVCVSVLLWSLACVHVNEVNFRAFKPLAQSFSAAWAVLLGISVPRMPITVQMRCLFIIYVWYCIAMSTVFQAFFTTYLVEPGYEARLKTMGDVVRAGLKYGTYPALDLAFFLIGYNDLDTFERELYSDVTKCARSVMWDGGTFTLLLSYYPKYLARVEGFEDENKILCFLDKSLFLVSLGTGLPKGSPLLSRLNEFLTQCIEAGLLEIYWSRLKHKVNLRAVVARDDSGYMAFNLNHFGSIFILLIIGYVLNLLVFFFELLHKQLAQKEKKKKKRCN